MAEMEKKTVNAMGDDCGLNVGSSDPVYLKRLIGELCYWRSIEPDNAYVSDSINRLKCLEKGY